VEVGFADDIGQRLALAATAHQRADLVQLRPGEYPFELQVELHALQAERVTDQNLRIETGAFHALRREKVGRLLDDFEDGKHGLSRRRGRPAPGGA